MPSLGRSSVGGVVRLEVSKRLEARVDVVGRVIVGALVERQPALDAQPRAIRAVERRDWHGQHELVADKRFEVDPVPVRTLTGLFTTAKFSHHPVDEGMKLAAISALERSRADLRAAAARAAEPHGAPEPAEPAATS